MGGTPVGGFSFRKVCIIESLPAGQLRTGWRLYDDYLKDKEYEIDGLSVEYIQVQSKDEFFDAFEKLRADLTSQTGANFAVPILHLEMHGCQGGLWLGSGKFVSHHQLFEYLSHINVLTENHLLVVVGACFGAHMIQIVQNNFDPPVPAPFWGIMGPTKEVLAGRLLDGCRAFYGTLLDTKDANLALSELRNAYADKGEEFLVIPSEYFFREAYRQFTAVYQSTEFLEYWIQDIMRRAKKIAGTRLGMRAYERHVRDKLETAQGREDHFNRVRDVFFMLDRFPENKTRFPLTYAEVVS